MALGALDRSLPDHVTLRSDILSKGRTNDAGHHEHTACVMSRHVMWHSRRAVR